MYLNRLNNKQKNLFLDMCIYAAMANNEVEEEEKQVLQEYCDEMRIDKIRLTPELPLKDVIDKLKEESTEEEIRMILLEITALLLADNEFDELEKKFVSNFADSVKLKESDLKKIVEILENLSKAYIEIDKFVKGEY